MALLSAPPTTALRWIFKVPLWLYRVHLGWLFGHRLVRITHRGRRTGRLRQTVAEVVRYDPRTREIVVAAGWGGRTGWYRNILATPAVGIRTGGVAYCPSQQLLTADETYREIEAYTQRHPWLARIMLSRLLGIPYDAPESERRAIVDAALRGVLFRPRSTARE